VQQKTGIQNPESARQYTQQGVDIINEQASNNPLLGGFLGGGDR
jgi:hypothetical protein